jgi:microcystin-dependent protein
MLNQHVRDNLNAALPIGSLVYRVAVATAIETVLENRFLECNGVAVSRTTYVDLFNYLNGLTPALAFGTGNGTTTFNIPDMRGRLLVSAAGVGGKTQVDVIGDNDGLTQPVRNINHSHTLTTGQAGGQGRIGENNTLPQPQNTQLTGGDQSNINTPAYLVAGVWFIKYVA